MISQIVYPNFTHYLNILPFRYYVYDVLLMIIQSQDKIVIEHVCCHLCRFSGATKYLKMRSNIYKNVRLKTVKIFKNYQNRLSNRILVNNSRQFVVQIHIEAKCTNIRLTTETQHMFLQCYRSHVIIKPKFLKFCVNYVFTGCKKLAKTHHCTNLYDLICPLLSNQSAKSSTLGIVADAAMNRILRDVFSDWNYIIVRIHISITLLKH